MKVAASGAFRGYGVDPRSRESNRTDVIGCDRECAADLLLPGETWLTSSLRPDQRCAEARSQLSTGQHRGVHKPNADNQLLRDASELRSRY